MNSKKKVVLLTLAQLTDFVYLHWLYTNVIPLTYAHQDTHNKQNPKVT